jgi:hypothetical protein
MPTGKGVVNARSCPAIRLRIDATAGSFGARTCDALTTTVRHMFRLDEDLSGFYRLIRDDGDLSWCALDAGRMLAPTVFDVAKTD